MIIDNQDQILNTQKHQNNEYSEEDIIYYDQSTNMIQRTKNYLRIIADQFHVNHSSLISLFNQYLDQELFQDYIIESNYSWFQIRSLDNWGFFADIALRLVCSPCSEASCERTISAQRLILTSRRYNSQKRLLDARLTLMTASYPEENIYNRSVAPK